MSLPTQEEEASLLAPKKIKMKTPVKRTRRKKVIRKVIPFPLVPKVILVEEDEEDNLPLSQRNHLAKATEVE